jgi:hypothetical protein
MQGYSAVWESVFFKTVISDLIHALGTKTRAPHHEQSFGFFSLTKATSIIAGCGIKDISVALERLCPPLFAFLSILPIYYS